MDNYRDLINKLKVFLHDDSIETETYQSDMKGISFLQLRDVILTIGDVFEEDEENQIYVAAIKAGLCKMGQAYIAAKIAGGTLYIAAYAKEGVFSQHLTEKSAKSLIELLKEKAADKPKDELSDTKSGRKKKKRVVLLTVGIIIFAVISAVVAGCLVLTPYSKSSKGYNDAISQYNEVAEKYNGMSSLAFLDNLQGFDNTAPVLPTVSTDFKSLITSLFNGNNTKKVESDIATINQLTTDLGNSTEVLEHIINPSDSFIAECLKKVDGISEVACVSNENDPNQMLGKEGGYTGCVYFSLSDIDLATVRGDDAISRGTDGGGAVEIFETKEDALRRCDYLDQFKGTLLYSGSYAAVGTLVIRTSYHLEDEYQYKLTAQIVDKLTAIPN